MLTNWIHYASKNLVETIFVFFLLTAIYLILTLLFTRKNTDKRYKHRYRMRLFYLMSVIFLLSIAQIWLNGFTHLLAILGLVSAAIVIANKESVMNITGCLIINWRELFAEGDFIKVQEIRGCVQTIGLFYFTVYETVDNQFTGSTVRVPNGLVITQPVVNYSSTENLSRQHIDVHLSINSDLTVAGKHLKEAASTYLETAYAKRQEFSMGFLRRHHSNFVQHHFSLKPKILFSIPSDPAKGIILTVEFFCFLEDTVEAKAVILARFLSIIKDKLDIKIAN